MSESAKTRAKSSWLRPPKPLSPDGTMSLMDHLRELRYRVTVSAIFVVVVTVVCLFFHRKLIQLIMWPYEQAKAAVIAAYPEAELQVVNLGVAAPLILVLKVSLVAAVIISCPFWLYQLWAFIAPALLKHEKRRAIAFLGAAIPLFLLGSGVGYYVLPKGISVLLQFTPYDLGITSMMDVGTFLSFELTLVLVFGLSFLLPVVLVTLNVFNLLRGYQLGRARSIAIFSTFVFAAVITPSVDPFSMLALAIPMSLLYLIAEVLCRINDKRRGITEASAEEFKIDIDDDE